MLQQVLDGARRLLGEDHPHTLTTLSNLARAFREEKRVDDALPLAQRALAQRRAKLGDDHSETLNAMAVTYDLAGRGQQALPLLEDVLHQRRRTLGDEHPDTLLSMSGLGRMYHLQGKLDESHTLLRALHKICQRTAPDDWLSFDNRILLGGVLLDLGRLEEAEAMLVSGYEGMVQRLRTVPAESRSRLGYAQRQIVKLYEARERPAVAPQWRQQLASDEHGAARGDGDVPPALTPAAGP